MKRLALVLAALGAGPAFAAGWPMYGYDIRQSRFNAAETAITPQTVGSLHQVWFLKTGGPVTATPSEVGGVVYVGSWDHNFYALDARTGAVKWKVTLATPQGDSKFPGIQSSALVANRRVYFGDSSPGARRHDGAEPRVRVERQGGPGLPVGHRRGAARPQRRREHRHLLVADPVHADGGSEQGSPPALRRRGLASGQPLHPRGPVCDRRVLGTDSVAVRYRPVVIDRRR